MDLAAEGVMLWDSDVQSFTELHITLSKLQKRRDELFRKKSEGGALSESEIEQLQEVDRLYEIYAGREKMLNENFTKELLETRGLSPVDIEVRKRLVEYLKSQNGGKEPPEYEVRMALWAARTAMIGSGRMAMIGAMMSKLHLESLGSTGQCQYLVAQTNTKHRSSCFNDVGSGSYCVIARLRISRAIR
mgnify:CR=1 FL=1